MELISSKKMQDKKTKQIIRSNVLLNAILNPWEERLGDAFKGYKNHALRVINLVYYMKDLNESDKKKLIIAAAFHDLGIWAEEKDNVDYIESSVDLVKKYLEDNNYGHDPEILLMITEHHKINEYEDEVFILVELFRRADLIDFSMGLVSFDIDKEFIKKLKEALPNEGFHKNLGRLTLKRLVEKPFKNPLPMMKS